MYWENIVIIFNFLKSGLQESLGLEFVMILMLFFWIINTFLAYEELPQRIIP